LLVDKSTHRAINLFPQMKILVRTIATLLVSNLLISSSNAQPTAPIPEDRPQQTSYLGFGGVIGLQGRTTSLSQGTFSILHKQVLNESLAIHSAATIFASAVPSASIALTFNQPTVVDNIPVIFTPFLGAGIMVYPDNGSKISPLITGGVDADTPFGFTGTLRINAGFVSDRQADVGILFGIGKNY
jgi:hypothetical protein